MIRFVCEHCGRSYEVDTSLAGRSGRCKGCGLTVTIPTATPLGDTKPEDGGSGYGLAEPEAPVVERRGLSVFVRAPVDPEPLTSKRTKSVRKKARPARRSTADWSLPDVKWLVGVPTALTLVLIGLTLFIPGLRIVVGSVLLTIGSLAVLVGYGVGAYAAFRQDLLYGILYITFPPYTAYYLVIHLDEFWPWLAGMTAGVLIASVGLWLVEPEHPCSPSGGPPPAIEAVGIREVCGYDFSWVHA